jgi:hypothetical protein
VLANLLNAQEGVALIGEAERHPAFARFDPTPEHYLDACSLCATHAEYRCPVWTADLAPRSAADGAELLATYRRILAAAGGPVVVDSSKSADWMAALLDAGLQVEALRAIVVARSPFAFLVSNRERLPGHSPVWHAVGWRDIYVHTLRVLAGRGIPFMVVRHETLVDDPVAWGRRMLAFLGLPAGTLDLSRMHARPAHPLGGNLRELSRMAGFDRAGLMRSGVTEAEDIRRLAETAPDYLGTDPVLARRAEAWRGLTEAEMAAVIQTPGVMEVFNALGYSLARFMGPMHGVG